MRTLALLAAMALLAVACEAEGTEGSAAEGEDEALAEAYEEGYDEGYEEGYDDALAEAEEADGPDDADEEEAAADDGADDDMSEELGSRDDPLPLGTELVIADNDQPTWEFTIADVDPDSEEAVLAANQFNDPPPEGYQYVTFTVDATYVGDETGSPWTDFRWLLVGSDGNSFRDGCGPIDNALRDQGETYPDGSVSGDVCIEASADQLDGGAIRVEPSFSFDDTAAYFEIP